MFRYGSVLLISILLAKVGLGTAEISIYEWLLYIGTTVSFFWVNGFLDAMLPVYPELPEKDQKSLLFSVFLQFFGFSLLIFLILYFGKNWIIPGLTGREDLPWYEWYCWFLLLNIPTNLTEYFYLLRKQALAVFYFGMMAFGLQIVAVMLPLLLGYGLGGSIKGLVILAAIKFLWLLVLVISTTNYRWRPSLIRQYSWLALPLLVYAFIGGFANLFDNWLVGWYFEDLGAFAVFRYGARELPLATALVGGLYTAMVPEVAKDLTTALRLLKEKSLKIYHWIFPLSIVLMLLSPVLFPLIFNEDFKESAWIFNIYLLLMCSRMLFPYTILMGLKKTRVILLISLAEILVNVLLSLLFVQFWGLQGIAFATVIAFLFEKAAMIIYLRVKYHISLRTYTKVNQLLTYSALLILAYFLSQALF